MPTRKFITMIALLLTSIALEAMETIQFNRGWRFTKGTELRSFTDGEAVDLPHTWNTADAMFGNTLYYRGMGTYLHELSFDESFADKRIFLRVNAAQSIADVFIDNQFITQHKGGYTAFTVDITPFIRIGSAQKLHIRVNNTQTTEVAPLSGDFNIYGGLHRGVDLLITEKTCINPAFYASSGVFFSQNKVTRERAELTVKALLSNPEGRFDGCEICFQIWNKDKLVKESISGAISQEGVCETSFTIRNPHLWDGVNDPFMYKGVVILKKNGIEIDRREENIGLRYYHADPEKGFFLNGKSYPLRGANLHQDRAERAAGYYPCDYDEDLDIMMEMGCNAVRLAHYQHAKLMHEGTDRRGMVAWAEIPFINIFINNPAYAENLREQLKELIYQNYNHPSILFWGLFNEINSGWMEDVNQMCQELTVLARQTDMTRPIVGATNQNDRFNGFTDYIAHNKYFGWYGDSPMEMEIWVNKEHLTHPERCMGISEYGAGGSVFQQSEELIHPEPWGQWHPENWQTHYHMENWRILQKRSYLWCTFVWCMYDFSSAGRKEGDTFGRNDKGLVTYDRKTRKDAYYFYKANWNTSDKFIYISERRNDRRTESTVDILVFSNCGEAELFINGISQGKQSPDEVNVIKWSDVRLDRGENKIKVINSHSSDQCSWILL